MKPSKKDYETMYWTGQVGQFQLDILIVPDFTHPESTVLLSLSQTDTIVLNKQEGRCKKRERERNSEMLHMVYQEPS